MTVAPVALPVALDIALLTLGEHRLHVLLRRAEARRWELPWMFIDATEPLAVTAAKLARASLGMRPGWLQQVVALDAAKRHPAGPGLSVAYTGVVAAGLSRIDEGKDDDGDVAWFPVDRLPALPPRQRAAIDEAMTSIRTRFDLTPIAFKLLPERFTLTELQEVYELLLQRTLHKASFRRALHGARLVAPIQEYRSEGRGRPAQLFRYKPPTKTNGRRAMRFDFSEL
jgi:8-oxo-dGTP diphosphatase